MAAARLDPRTKSSVGFGGERDKRRLESWLLDRMVEVMRESREEEPTPTMGAPLQRRGGAAVDQYAMLFTTNPAPATGAEQLRQDQERGIMRVNRSTRDWDEQAMLNAKEELRLFDAEAVLPRLEENKDGQMIEQNPLTWWKVRASKFPNLAVLARKWLCIPATLAPSERVFSCKALPSPRTGRGC
jgi:hypothetical protein